MTWHQRALGGNPLKNSSEGVGTFENTNISQRIVYSHVPEVFQTRTTGVADIVCVNNVT